MTARVRNIDRIIGIRLQIRQSIRILTGNVILLKIIILYQHHVEDVPIRFIVARPGNQRRVMGLFGHGHTIRLFTYRFGFGFRHNRSRIDILLRRQALRKRLTEKHQTMPEFLCFGAFSYTAITFRINRIYAFIDEDCFALSLRTSANTRS